MPCLCAGTFIIPSSYVSDVANSSVKFDEKGDGLARYTIYNYQKDEQNNTDYKVGYYLIRHLQSTITKKSIT